MIVGMRQRSAQWLGPLALLSVSVIALALAFFPALAQAECTSSSCVEYTESLPEAGNGTSTHHKQNPAKASKSGDGGSNPTGSGKQGSKNAESGEGESSEPGGVAGSGNGSGPPQGKAGGSPNGTSGGGTQNGGQSGSGVPTSESSGGDSSPLVPILIAIAVLAAISVAAVLYRQRRQRRSPTGNASPEAS
jgi:cobalamin biosynthesis Mg chelatase CobN